MFGSNLNKPKFYSERNYEKTEFRECLYAVKNLLTYSLLFKSLKIKIYRTIILPVVLYGCEFWSLTVREESRHRVFENRVLRKYLGLRGTRKQGSGENYIMRNLVISTPHQILFK
jgi:hypothetical protein